MAETQGNTAVGTHILVRCSDLISRGCTAQLLVEAMAFHAPRSLSVAVHAAQWRLAQFTMPVQAMQVPVLAFICPACAAAGEAAAHKETTPLPDILGNRKTPR